MIACNQRFVPDVILTEDRASGTQLVQELIAAGCAHATHVSPQGDKVTRMHADSVAIENGLVFLPETAPWLADTLAEFLAFPKGRHDDQVDSTAQGAGLGQVGTARRAGWSMMRSWRGRLGAAATSVFTFLCACAYGGYSASKSVPGGSFPPASL